MKNSIVVSALFLLFITSCSVLTNVEKPVASEQVFLTRANGTAAGKLSLGKVTGSIQLGSSGLDKVYDIVYGTGSPSKVTFKRKGSYNQSFTGWLSTDKKQIGGYFVSNNKKFPFTCTVTDNIVYSATKQKDLNGGWALRCNGTATGQLTINNSQGTLQVGSSKNDKISIVKNQKTGSSGASEIQFQRTGSYNQMFYGWISSDKKQMSGYYVQSGKEYPFYAFRK